MARIMFSAIASNSGKTTIVCGILKALKNRQLNIRAFKCGPDYIDSMYHKAIGVESSNLDSFFCNRDEICYLLDNNSIGIIEGAMGFYDGISFTEKASAYEISNITNTPVVLIINGKGMANSVGAIIKGALEYRQNNIKGVIFNQISPMVYTKFKTIVENLGLIPLGFIPKIDDISFNSRHLGLEQPADINNKLDILAQYVEKYIELDKIIDIAENVDNLEYSPITFDKKYNKKIAISYDDAFRFVYDDNIRVLREYGCDIQYFSPLKDKKLPDCDRLIISGGYPELYADILSQNVELLEDIKCKINDGVKTIAECGGFMYLHSEMEDINGNLYKMANVINGKCYKTDRLQRFGYFNMTALCDNVLCKKGETLTIHEFHYWDSTNCGDSFVLNKPNSNREHRACITKDRFYGGFPHIYFLGNRKIVENFLED